MVVLRQGPGPEVLPGTAAQVACVSCTARHQRLADLASGQWSESSREELPE